MCDALLSGRVGPTRVRMILRDFVRISNKVSSGWVIDVGCNEEGLDSKSNSGDPVAVGSLYHKIGVYENRTHYDPRGTFPRQN